MGESTSESANAGPSIRICLVGEVVDDPETLTAAKHFKVPILTSETGSEYALEKDTWITYFILKDFEGPMFEALSKSPNKYVRSIFGPTYICNCFQRPLSTAQLTLVHFYSQFPLS